MEKTKPQTLKLNLACQASKNEIFPRLSSEVKTIVDDEEAWRMVGPFRV